MTFRAAGVDDIDTLIDLRVQFLNEAFHRTSGKDTEQLKIDLRKYFQRTIPAGEFIAWLAMHKGEVVATSGMSVWWCPPKYGGSPTGQKGYIMNMYTVPRLRQMGIATHLLEELLKDARERGITFVHLHATLLGMGIYRKAGFKDPVFEELVMKLK